MVMIDTQKKGGKREGAGRPAPLGRKKTCTVRLDPQVEAFCRANGGLAMLNEMCRKSKEFRAWVKSQQFADGGNSR